VAPNSQRRICVAKIGAPHGVRGEVKLWPYTANPMAVKEFGTLETEDGKRAFTIEALRPAKDFLVARFKGVADRNAAETLCHLELYVARERLPEPDDDEFYHADLIGLAAVDPAGAPIGTIAGVHNFGAGDLLEIRLAASGKTELIPFTDDVVPEVEITAGRVVVVMPTIDTAEEE
jgi:16S rRNA processing protein RimM